MRDDAQKGRQTNRRAFRPAWEFEGPLEPRFLLSAPRTPTGRHAYGPQNQPRYVPPPNSIIPQVGAQVAHGGQSVVLTSTSGAHFVARLQTSTGLPGQTPATNLGQPAAIGTVRAYPMSGGRVGLGH